jgi:hypothetical protein
MDKITIFCVGDQSKRSILIDYAFWMQFLDTYLEKNKNLHKWAFDPYRKLENHSLYHTLYDELEHHSDRTAM